MNNPPPEPTPWAERERALETMNADFDRRILEQATSANGIDTKATFLLGATAIAVQVFLGLDRQDDLAVLAFSGFVATFACGLTSIWPRSYQVIPFPDAVNADYEQWKDSGLANVRELILGKLVGGKAQVITAARNRYRKKVRWWRNALIAFAVALILSGLSVLEAGDGAKPGGRHLPSGGPGSGEHRTRPFMDGQRNP